jgi:putative sigma-54 modulation protein
MDITVTGRHVEATTALKDYAAKRVGQIGIDFPRIISVHVILEVDKFRHIADIVLHCANHINIEAREVSEDLYASIDRVVDKAARQMRKYKTRLQNHHRPRRATIRHIDEQVFTHDLHEEEGKTQHIRTEEYPVKPMFVDEAVLQLELSDHRQFLMFLNADTEHVNVLYRRRNGDFGLLKPTPA